MRLKKAFDDGLIAAAHNYKDKLIAEVEEGKRGSSYKAINPNQTGGGAKWPTGF